MINYPAFLFFYCFPFIYLVTTGQQINSAVNNALKICAIKWGEKRGDCKTKAHLNVSKI